jgi:tRNA (guanine37-N1)-methyltransferase
MALSPGIKVQRRYGERFRLALVELGALDRNRRILSDEAHLYLPVLRLEDAAAAVEATGEFEPVEMEFPLELRPSKPEEILGYSPSFDMVGDIAIVAPEDAEKAASALISTCRSVRVVLVPASDVEGEFRTRRFRHVAGEERTVTVHKEHGLRYRLDLESVYFTPHLGTERLRVAEQARPEDVVLDMFAGVGPFALLMARRCRRVIAVEKNPAAIGYLRENALLNRIENVEIREGDASVLALEYESQADHVIMNLPHSASQFLEPAMRASRKGGMIHYYAIAPEEELYEDEELVQASAARLGLDAEVLYRGIVRSYSPRRYNVVMDIQVR